MPITDFQTRVDAAIAEALVAEEFTFVSQRVPYGDGKTILRLWRVSLSSPDDLAFRVVLIGTAGLLIVTSPIHLHDGTMELVGRVTQAFADNVPFVRLSGSFPGPDVWIRAEFPLDLTSVAPLSRFTIRSAIYSVGTAQMILSRQFPGQIEPRDEDLLPSLDLVLPDELSGASSPSPADALSKPSSS